MFQTNWLYREVKVIYLYVKVRDYHFPHVYDFPIWIISPLLPLLPQTNLIGLCCLSSLALSVLSYLEDSTHLSLQNKPQTFLFKFAFWCQVWRQRQEGKTGRQEEVKVRRERRKERRKSRAESVDEGVSTLLNMTEMWGMSAMFFLPDSLSTTASLSPPLTFLSPPSSGASHLFLSIFFS